ncbi:MAG: gluconate 2-dehydrogenase subunit 3 family protein, partial [Gemmatimonadetes bacterium]|nr:gluconate 2-dehydrogenase subunit 3 family protein [Gemmatimonadota bacterium]
MKRREVLQLAASSAALALLPKDCHLPWSRVGKVVVGPTLEPAQRDAVRAFADALLPRTATPGAVDVGVPAFVDVIVAEQYGEPERAGLASGLAHLEAAAKREGGAFATLAPAAREKVMRALEAP